MAVDIIEELSTLLEPFNLFLIAVCGFLLYKIIFAPADPGKDVKKEPAVEQVVGDLTVEQLLAYDGKDPTKPVLLAVCGKIFDVTAGKHFYGPGGPYEVLAGHDATRALALMSNEHSAVKDVDDDLSDLTRGQLSTAREWEQSFQFKYRYVGALVKESDSGEGKDDEQAKTDDEPPSPSATPEPTGNEEASTDGADVSEDTNIPSDP
eukprot:scpid78563/ scgid14829/ Membrane-associated progesterone receptor component 1